MLEACIGPADVKYAEERANDVQNRVADTTTRFSGSMTFDYLHVIRFASWFGFGVGDDPFRAVGGGPATGHE